MKQKEAKTDLWVFSLLDEAGIHLEPQGSSVEEIDEALKTASKKGNGNIGFPEYVGVVKDYLLVIEDKADINFHIKFTENGTCISKETKDITSYAVNGAVFYGEHLAKNTTYKKIIAFGVSGDEKAHRISPVFIDGTEYYRELTDVESFINFNENNIDEYYTKEVLHENTDNEKETSEIIKDAKELHENLRNHGNLKDTDKPLVVSGILLALREGEYKGFSVNDLIGDTVKTDGQKIYDAIRNNLIRSQVAPEVKKDKLLTQFSIIKDSFKLNEIDKTLNKTPLRYFTEFLEKKIYKTIRYTNSAEDYLGRFYGEFMSYSGGDGQTLGIVLTPKHITQLFCDLLDVKPTDIIFDPCCGTAGFLIAAMHNMLQKTNDEKLKKEIKQKQLHGIELQSYMFTIATTNMILRGDGKSNLIPEDFLKLDPNKLQLKGSTVGMMNPPYSQGSNQNPNLYEIAFTEHLLNSLTKGARCAVIVPQSSMTGKTKEEQKIKYNILKKHTLEGVISLSKDTFYRIGVVPCIAIFTAGEPHAKDKICKFINFEDDGFEVSKHIGLIETEAAKDKKQHLLDVWFERIEAPTKFCVSTKIDVNDEWLHSFYYFNDEIPTEYDFEQTINNYLSFEFSMIMQGRQYLFEQSKKCNTNKTLDFNYKELPALNKREWKEFKIADIFKMDTKKATNVPTGSYIPKKQLKKGETPRITVTSQNNGIDSFCSSESANYRTYTNFISVSFLGTVFYQPFTASLDMKVHSLQLLDRKLNSQLGRFLVTEIRKSIKNASYGNQISSADLASKKILLPVDSNGLLDYEYMEQYIASVDYSKYTEYISHIRTSRRD